MNSRVVDEVVLAETPSATYSGRSTVRNANKNVYGIAFCIFTNAFAYQGLQNIQSSINKDEGLGLVSLAILCAGYMVSSILTVGMVKSIGTRYTIIFGSVAYLIFIALNYHPRWYTLVPGSLVAGLGSGPLIVASNCHLIAMAVRMAPILNERKEVLVGKYLGILYLANGLAMPPGNIASSLLFYYTEKYGNISSNETNATSFNCGLLETFRIDSIYLHILISVYAFIQILSLLSAILFIDNTVATPSTFAEKASVLMTATTSTVKNAFSINVLVLAPIGIYSGIELSFPSGIFARVSFFIH